MSKKCEKCNGDGYILVSLWPGVEFEDCECGGVGVMDARDKHRMNMTKLATRAYAKHEIKKSSEDRWLIQQRHKDGGWDSNTWTEIIALHHKGLLVDGDIDPVVFRYGPADPEARVRWMGNRKHAHDHYFREKASIGMGGRFHDITEIWEPEVAADDLRVMEARFLGKDEDWPMEPNQKAADDVAHVRECYLENGRDTVLWKLYEINEVDSEELASIGMVTAPRLYWAHGALAKLVNLLDARDARRSTSASTSAPPGPTSA